MCVLYAIRWAPFIGLVLIAFGTGGIKPNVSAFGGDQFSPEQVSINDNRRQHKQKNLCIFVILYIPNKLVNLLIAYICAAHAIITKT